MLQEVDHRQVLDFLYRKTALVVLLVRDRLEREKPLEAKFETERSMLMSNHNIRLDGKITLLSPLSHIGESAAQIHS